MDAVRIYEMTVRSFLPLPGPKVSAEEPDIDIVRCPDRTRPPFEPDRDSRLYANPEVEDGRPPVVEFHRRGRSCCLRYPGYVDFFFSGRGPVACFAQPNVPPEILQSLILGPLCAVLLELRGTICLHASAVCIGDSAVALAGRSGTGKSTLAAWFVDQGHPLLSDDVLPLRIDADGCRAVPGCPQLRVPVPVLSGPFGTAPAAVRQAADSIDDKHVVGVGQGWGAFAAAPLPLRVVYVLDRALGSQGGVSIEPLPPSRGFVELLRFGFCSRLAAALGLSASRFKVLAEAAGRISVRQLRLPNDLRLIGDVYRAIRDDLDPSYSSRSEA